MSQDQSYPSPEAPHADLHPFYPNQHSVPVAEGPPARMHEASGSSQALDPGHRIFHDFEEPTPSTPQQLAQRSLDVDQSRSQSNSDLSSKKKNKVSRACDECRRKKIKCDAELEAPGVKCSACSRSDSRCEFSRAPQKRGPSKGYIKELAERVNMLEYRSGAVPPDMQFSTPNHGLTSQDDAFSPQPEFMGPNAKKRTHSVAEGSQEYLLGQEQLQAFTRGYSSTSNSDFIREGIASRGGGPSQYRTFDHAQNLSGDMSGLDEVTLKGYYDQIHTYLPLLPDNIPQLRSSLESVSHEIREAFTAALYAAVKSCDLSNVAFAADISNVTKSIKTASELLLVVQTEEPTNRTTAENAIYLQALILMIFVSEGSGPGRNQDSSWFGLAFSIATYLKLHVNYGAPFGTELHLKTGRKAWLILVILDRWHAASTSGPQIIADNESLELYLSDQALLGDTAFHLVRLSLVLGHLSDTFLIHQPDFVKRSSTGLFTRVMKGEIERFRETMQEGFDFSSHYSVVHLAYLHVKLLSCRHLEMYPSNVGEIINSGINIVSHQNQPTLFTHHFTALAALTLTEGLAGDSVISDPPGIINALKELQQQLMPGYIPPHLARPGWGSAVSRFVSRKLEQFQQPKDRGGLQHLADAAISESHADGKHGNGASRKAEGDLYDWSTVRSKGYLTVFE